LTQTEIVSLEKTHFSIFCHKKGEKGEKTDRQTDKKGVLKQNFSIFCHKKGEKKKWEEKCLSRGRASFSQRWQNHYLNTSSNRPTDEGINRQIERQKR